MNLNCLYERCPDCGHNTLDPLTKKCTFCTVKDSTTHKAVDSRPEQVTPIAESLAQPQKVDVEELKRRIQAMPADRKRVLFESFFNWVYEVEDEDDDAEAERIFQMSDEEVTAELVAACVDVEALNRRTAALLAELKAKYTEAPEIPTTEESTCLSSIPKSASETPRVTEVKT